MKIGILGAMLCEIEYLKHDIENPTASHCIGREFISGDLHGHEATIVYSKTGKVASAITVSALINQFNVDMIIFTGVAGAVAGDISIGDVVIADCLYQHDMDASPIFPKFEIPFLGKSKFMPNQHLLQGLESSCNDFLQGVSAHIDPNILGQFDISTPRTHVGTIATGDQFVADTQKHDDLHASGFGSVKAVEMEGAAVAQACEDYGIPYAIIRTISDKADHSATVDFNSFVEEVSNHYSQHIIRIYFEKYLKELLEQQLQPSLCEVL